MSTKLAVRKADQLIEIPGFVVTPTGLGNPSFEVWVEAGKRIRAAHQLTHWLLEDWWQYGEHRYAR
jgi:hypothetical protein